jgi:glycosyltransferase involved in cell wall biosynthesis
MSGPVGPTRLLLLIAEMEVGGTQRQIVNIAGNLDRARFDPTVLFFRHRSFLVDELQQNGVAVIQVRKRARLDPLFLPRLVSVLGHGRFDVMHCFGFTAELWGATARRCLPVRLRPALISSVRNTYEWYSDWQWTIKRWVSTQSFRVVSNSRAGAAYACARMGLPDQTMTIVYNGVRSLRASAGAAASLRAGLRASTAAFVVLFVGRLVEQKGISTLLRAVARLRRGVPEVRVWLAGDGPMRGLLERQIGDAGIGDVVSVLGERNDVGDLIDAADVVVLPSVREGLSNVVLEGMIGGRPVIASRAGGNPELVQDQVTGMLFDIGDDVALCDALARLANEPRLRESLGRAARIRAELEFSVTAMKTKLEGIYGAARAVRASQSAATPTVSRETAR